MCTSTETEIRTETENSGLRSGFFPQQLNEFISEISLGELVIFGEEEKLDSLLGELSKQLVLETSTKKNRCLWLQILPSNGLCAAVVFFLESTLEWESFEQSCVWQLIQAEDVLLESIVGILPLLNPEQHSEALANLLILTKSVP